MDMIVLPTLVFLVYVYRNPNSKIIKKELEVG
jgi:hypothetical protein